MKLTNNLTPAALCEYLISLGYKASLDGIKTILITNEAETLSINATAGAVQRFIIMGI